MCGMAITKETKDRLLRYLAMLLVGALGYILQSLTREVAAPIAEHVVPAISKTTLLWLCLLLGLVSVVSITWLLILIFGDPVARLKRRYEFVEVPGFWKHRETGQRVCGSCLLNGIESPLAKTGDDFHIYWQCTNKNCMLKYERVPGK